MRALGLVVLCSMAGACFTGESTLGAVCRDDTDCGADQRCTLEICGACGDAVPQRGELCLLAPESAEAPSFEGALLAFDLERDGNPDLLARGADGRPQWWSGAGDGTWAAGGALDVGGTRGVLRVGDLDADGLIDLVVVDADALTLHLGFGDGMGTWSFGEPVVLTAEPSDLAVAAPLGDEPGWVVWSDAEGLRQVAVNAPARAFEDPVTLVSGGTRWLGQSMSLDDDEAIDLAVADVDGRRLEPWFGDGAGGLSPGAPLSLVGRPTEVVTADLDGDGDPDLLVPDDGGGVTVILTDGQGNLGISERLSVPGSAGPVAVADLDRNLVVDVIVGSGGERPLWVFPGRLGGYPDAIELPVETSVGSLLALDVDRDGLTELLLGPADGVGSLRIMEVDP